MNGANLKTKEHRSTYIELSRPKQNLITTGMSKIEL